MRLLFLLSLLIVSAGAQTEAPNRQPAPFAIHNLNDRSVEVREGSRPVLVYNFGIITNSAAPLSKGRSSYIHPLYGLKGEVLTGDFPKDHLYHRGLYWAWSHIVIDGQEVDSWSLRGIETKFERWLSREVKGSKAVLAAENGWYVKGRKVMAEQVRLEVLPATAEGRAIDLSLEWRPTDKAVTLSGAPGKSYGGLTFRFGNRSKTVITVPAGKTTDDLLMTNLPWADLSGDFASQGGGMSGASVFVHPEHPDYPPTWMTRHYGVLAVGWPGVTPKTFGPGQRISVRYRIWIHNGEGHAEGLQKAYDAYRRESMPEK
jgi:hypothetical protein